MSLRRLLGTHLGPYAATLLGGVAAGGADVRHADAARAQLDLIDDGVLVGDRATSGAPAR
jgi:hypothetical protein